MECVCKMCGKNFTPVRKYAELCSRRCQSLWVQNSGLGLKKDYETVVNEIKALIRKEGTSVSLARIKELKICGEKWFYRNKLSLKDLFKELGLTNTLNDLSRTELLDLIRRTIEKNKLKVFPTIEELKELLPGFSNGLLQRRQISLKQLRESMGLPRSRTGFSKFKTKVQVEHAIIKLLKKANRPMSVREVLDTLKIDYYCTFKHFDINLLELHKTAGVEHTTSSLYENLVFAALRDIIPESVEIIWQHSFENCRLQRKLRFDFFIPEFNLLVEADGLQHDIETNTWFEATKKSDDVKEKFVEDTRGLMLIRVKQLTHTTLKDITAFLETELKALGVMSSEKTTLIAGNSH